MKKSSIKQNRTSPKRSVQPKNSKENNKKKIPSQSIQKKSTKNIPSQKNVVKRNVKNNIREFPNAQVKKEKNERLEKERKKIRKRRTFIISSFLLIGLVIVLVYLVFHLSIFDLKKITVTGNSKYTSSEIIAKSNFKINENILIQYLKYKNNVVNDLPYISSIVPHISFPDEIEFEVVERKSKYVAFDKEKNKYYRLNEEGYILEESSKSNLQEGEVLVQGITFNNKVVLGEKINEIDLNKLLVFEKIGEEFKKSKINGNITKVNFENSLTTITLNDKLNVILPNDTNLKYNMDLLNSILKKNGDLQGVIDMTKEDPVYSIF